MDDIMTYVLTGIALSFGAGIALASRLSIPLIVLWITAACSAAASLVPHAIPRAGRIAALLLTVLLLGMLRGSVGNEFPDWLIQRAPGIESLTGTVVSYPDVETDSISFTLAPRDLPGNVSVVWNCATPLGIIHIGDEVCVYGSAKLPEAFDGFDYPAYLARRGIFATLFADDVITAEDAVNRPSLWRWGDKLRQRILARFRESLSPSVAAMAQSLMLGDRSALPPDTEDAFSRTGLMHLLAVSGLHLGIFLGVAWWGLRWIGLRPRFAYPLVGALVILALVVVGPRVSLVRAGLLFAFLALGSVLADFGLILRRWVHPLNGLAAAAITILLLRPGALHDVGFQLTMAATASILIAFAPSGWGTRLLSNPRVERLRSPWQWLFRLLVVTVSAQAGAMPVIAWHFHAFHPLSVLANPVVVPLAALSLWAGLVAVFLMGMPLFVVAAAPFAFLLRALEAVVRWLAGIPWVELPVVPILGVWMAGCVAFVYLASHYESESSRTSNSMSIESDFDGG
jgi:ComEC/Rec2-related protein